jgi:hypothetical protein
MGQFMGWQSYDLPHRCDVCGELGEEEDIEQCCQGNEQEFLKQSEKTIEEMGQEGCYLSQKEKEDKDES